MLIYLLAFKILAFICLCFACLHAKKEVPPLPEIASVSQSASLKTEGFMIFCWGPCKGIREDVQRKGEYLTQ